MKVAAIIFMVLGILANFAYSILLGVIGAIVGIIAIITLANDKKSVAVGVLSLLLTGLIGGILYLCWNPEN